jgi:hypothetical protein
VKAWITIDGKTTALGDKEIRIQIETDRLVDQYLLQVFTHEGIITDVVDSTTGESEGTCSEMYDDIASRLGCDRY